MDSSSAREGSDSEFFVLRRPPPSSETERIAGTEALTAEGAVLGDSARCTACGGAIGMRRWLPPYRIEVKAWGRRFADLVVLTGENLLVSELFRRVYDESQLTGLSDFCPVEIVRVHSRTRGLRESSPLYFKADVARSRAAVDLEQSGLRWDKAAPICPDCRVARGAIKKGWSRIVLEPNSWRGEDIFIARGLNEKLVSQRFKDACQGRNVAGLYFIPAAECAVDFYRRQ